jgi:hypothetical protein
VKRIENLHERFRLAMRTIDEIVDNEYIGMIPSGISAWESLDRMQAKLLVLELRAVSATVEELFGL